MKPKIKHIVFSDLDGTLLDHHTYSTSESREGIDLLRKYPVPLVLVSSKTCSEMTVIHQKLKLESPFVFENGGGIAFPERTQSTGKNYRIKILGMDINTLKKGLPRLESLISTRLSILTDMDTGRIVELTGLTQQQSLLAMERKTTIPFVLENEKVLSLEVMEQINKTLRKDGMCITRGGRFYHFMSSQASKGDAIQRVITFYKQTFKTGPIISIAIGDSENDIPMLQAVDIPFLVRKPDNSYIDIAFKVKRTERIGPAGFSEAIKSVFTEEA